MPVPRWTTVAGAGQYPYKIGPSQYFMLAGVRALCIQCPNGRLNVGQRPTQWPGIGLMHVTPTHCQVNGGLA